MLRLFLALALLFSASIAFGQTASLRQAIHDILLTKKATVGVAVWGLEDGDTLSVNGNGHFPMQSVYKFHLGLAVLAQVDKGKFTLDQDIWIKKADLKPQTWSPLRDKYPEGERFVPLSELLRYTIGFSDNNACDILFGLVGGPKKVERYLRKLGYKDVSIVSPEEAMHKDRQQQYRNWTTPLAAVRLLGQFYTKSPLSAESSTFLWATMLGTTTGPKRLKGLLPSGVAVAHKTGTSDTDEAGVTGAVNDIGIVTLPNGKHVAIAVFVSRSREDFETNERIIAEIGKAVWDYFSQKTD